jgi:hypothetical protein
VCDHAARSRPVVDGDLRRAGDLSAHACSLARDAYVCGAAVTMGSPKTYGTTAPTRASTAASGTTASGSSGSAAARGPSLFIEAWRCHYNEVRPHSSLGLLDTASVQAETESETINLRECQFYGTGGPLKAGRSRSRRGARCRSYAVAGRSGISAHDTIHVGHVLLQHLSLQTRNELFGSFGRATLSVSSVLSLRTGTTLISTMHSPQRRCTWWSKTLALRTVVRAVIRGQLSPARAARVTSNTPPDSTRVTVAAETTYFTSLEEITIDRRLFVA